MFYENINTMKKIWLTVAGSLLIALSAANAQERSDTTRTRATDESSTNYRRSTDTNTESGIEGNTNTIQGKSGTQGQYGSEDMSMQWRDEDRMSVSREELPESLVETLKSDDYEGWENATIYKNKNTDDYMLVMQDNGKVKTFYFDKEGKAHSMGAGQDDQSSSGAGTSGTSGYGTSGTGTSGAGTSGSGSSSTPDNSSYGTTGASGTTGTSGTGSSSQSGSDNSMSTSGTSSGTTTPSGTSSPSDLQDDTSTSGSAAGTSSSGSISSGNESTSGGAGSASGSSSATSGSTGSTSGSSGTMSSEAQTSSPANSTQPSTISDSNESNAWKSEDRVVVTSEELPSSLRLTLDDDQYEGWENSTMYRNRTTNEYMIEIRDGSSSKIYYFDKDGKPKRQD